MKSGVEDSEYRFFGLKLSMLRAQRLPERVPHERCGRHRRNRRQLSAQCLAQWLRSVRFLKAAIGISACTLTAASETNATLEQC